MRRITRHIHWRPHWNIAWLRYPLWLWLAFSLLCWFGLPKSVQMTMTPLVCSVLLIATAVLLNWARIAVSMHPGAVGVKKELRDMFLAVCTTGVIGLTFPLIFHRMAGDSPTEVACMLAWVLCSAGFVLSLMVSKMLMSFVRYIDNHPEKLS